jgi:hypothetical protein
VDTTHVNCVCVCGVCDVCGLGYFSLFLVGTRLGSMLLVDRKTRRDGWRLVMRLAALDVLLWVVTLAVDAYVEPNSRRMVRLPVQCAAAPVCACVCVIRTASLTRTHRTRRGIDTGRR